MLSRLVLSAYINMFTSLVAGSGVSFVENDVFVRLRSEGHVTAGYLPRMANANDQDGFQDKISLVFKQLKFLTSGDMALYVYQTGGELWDIKQAPFHNYRDLSVHAMSMKSYITALGITLNIKGVIFKEDGKLNLDDDISIDVRQGEVSVSVEVLPVDDIDIDCIACHVDDGYVIQVEFDVTHVGDAEISDVRTDTTFYSYEYADDAIIHIPKQVLVDDTMQSADVNITGTGQVHNVIARLPAPLGNKLEMNFIFKVTEQTEHLNTTSAPEQQTAEVKTVRTPSISVEYVQRDTHRPSDTQRDAESRDHVNTADEDETKVIQVKYTTTTTTTARVTTRTTTTVASEGDDAGVVLHERSDGAHGGGQASFSPSVSIVLITLYLRMSL